MGCEGSCRKIILKIVWGFFEEKFSIGGVSVFYGEKIGRDQGKDVVQYCIGESNIILRYDRICKCFRKCCAITLPVYFVLMKNIHSLFLCNVT